MQLFNKLLLGLALGSPCFSAFIDLPLLDIKGAGLGKFAVFDGAAEDDTLLWRSDTDQDQNRFRLWSLDGGLFYGVTFGMTDNAPGQLAAFCGYEAGRNSGTYDLAAGKLMFRNAEPPPVADYAGQVLHLDTGDIKVKKGKANIKSQQGEFTDPAKLEFFLFSFDKTSANGPAMTHDLFAGGPVAGHPANYNANKVNLTQALTIAAMYGAFESGTHVWNPKKPDVMLIDFPGSWEFECAGAGSVSGVAADVCSTPTEQQVSDYLALTQPADVPEPATIWLVIAGMACLLLAGQYRNSQIDRCPIAVRSCILLIAAATSIFCADDIRWGRVEGDLQLGIGATSTAEPALHVLLKNAGAEAREILIGFEGSAGPVFNVTITANAPREPERLVFDLNALRALPTGARFSRSARLEPGGFQEFTYALKQLICVVSRQDVPLLTLLKQGYTVRASFQVGGTRVASPRFEYVRKAGPGGPARTRASAPPLDP